ncbi:sn-glycerol-3-phosphate ABC transporter ATP-binding protein UgpC [Clostridium oceanicum]|uniref:Sn-glycerol-3-phosphate ABC transporter ATP-binding protein UgpC n=1 Tax=Clostridium oceanicum TaxID=1543 RepID=A0ABP3UET1_9CLOT
MANLDLKNINKIYSNKVHVVKDFDLHIKDKEFIVLVGPSGCGKSTTLRMIAGLEDIFSGELYIDNEIMNDIKPKDRDIAMVFQNYALYPHMTVFENMSFGLKLRKQDKEDIRKKVESAAKTLDILHLLDRKPKELSGGQRQRVALGRAIVRKPKVFLMDEPLSNLDAKLRVQMRGELIKLHKELQTTFVYVTHDQTEAMTMGDRIIVMKDGVIQQVDNPKTIYNNPANLFVASFIGSPQINTIDGILIQKDNRVYFKSQNITIEIPKNKIKLVEDKINEEIVLGIRPENMFEKNEVRFDKKCSIKGVLEVKELLGSEMYIYIKAGNDKIVARVSPDFTGKYNESIEVSFHKDKIHLFLKKNGENIF